MYACFQVPAEEWRATAVAVLFTEVFNEMSKPKLERKPLTLTRLNDVLRDHHLTGDTVRIADLPDGVCKKLMMAVNTYNNQAGSGRVVGIGGSGGSNGGFGGGDSMLLYQYTR